MGPNRRQVVVSSVQSMKQNFQHSSYAQVTAITMTSNLNAKMKVSTRRNDQPLHALGFYEPAQLRPSQTVDLSASVPVGAAEASQWSARD